MTNIVHEAETQRQHPRYRIPVQVELFGKTYPATDVSAGGVGISNADFDLGVGRVEKGRLIFPMEGYSFTIDLDMELRYVRRDEGHAGFRFQNTTKQTQSALRYISDAYISGEVVRLNDILTVLARDNDSKVRKQVTGKADDSKTRIPPGYLILLGTAALLIAFIGWSMYQRLFINEVTEANIHVATVAIRAPANGQLTFVRTSEQVAAGDQFAALLTTAEDKEIVINSPCNCFVMTSAALPDAFVGKGDELAVLVDQQAEPFVRVLVNREDLLAIYEGADVTVRFPDGTKEKPKTIRRVSYDGEIIENGVVYHQLIMEVDKPLSLSEVGNPVSVIINRFNKRKRTITPAEQSVEG